MEILNGENSFFTEIRNNERFEFVFVSCLFPFDRIILWFPQINNTHSSSIPILIDSIILLIRTQKLIPFTNCFDGTPAFVETGNSKVYPNLKKSRRKKRQCAEFCSSLNRNKFLERNAEQFANYIDSTTLYHRQYFTFRRE